MKKTTKVIAVLLAALMLAAMSVLAFADFSVDPTPSEDINIQVEMVKDTIREFLTAEYKYVREGGEREGLTRLAPAAQGMDAIKFQLSYFDYQAAVYEYLGWEFVYDNVEFSDFSVTLNGDNAEASVVTKHTFYLTDGFDKESFRSRENYFTLTKIGSAWKIVNWTTNDPWELSDEFRYEVIDTDAAIEALRLSEQEARERVVPARNLAAEAAEANSAASTLYHWDYDVDKAIAYAETYYATNNSLFPDFSSNGGNCQNFASQCVWAGLGGTTSLTAYPAVSTGSVGSSSPQVWSCGQYTTAYSDTNTLYNWAWTRCESFLKLIDVSGTGTIGPIGWSEFRTLYDTKTGCVIHVDWGGNATMDSVDHAMFVTKVVGTTGQRTVSDIYVAAHSEPTNCAREALTSYIPAYTASASYAETHFVGGKYPVTQP